ncbi:zinc-ribbon domain-containing protein [Spongiibacter nanhainus]|uniref:Zinc-ribbon domain-containing protein n=1 Tax=Spongiibacter nanhainus TaxID=2794344 RepID=A0A7T4UR37_9GAMM|nr:DUF3426 domain-containing protein [Spongiibacter nanhainus]QQD19413.1 zinc-ribbon domain-containing protein [Spongiibacter nanhainus]
MSSTDSVTCPECLTRFRVDAEQLALANGLLRCGVCSHVFNARDDGPGSDIDDEARQDAEDTQGDSADTQSFPDAPSPEPLDAQLTDKASPAQSQGEAHGDSSNIESPANEQTEVESPVHSTVQSTGNQPPKNKADILLEGLSTVNHDFEHHQHHRRARRWPWLLLNLVALLVLAGQVAYWQRDALLASPARDTVLIACQWLALPCEAQSSTATSPAGSTPSAKPSQVSTSRLLVRKHPERDQALIVDTILINRGEQTVAFPPLLLRFSDINGQEVASRIFTPSDYLHGELNALSDLAPQQPVHIALEIVDPGAAAVNYELEVLASN